LVNTGNATMRVASKTAKPLVNLSMPNIALEQDVIAAAITIALVFCICTFLM